MRVCDTLSFGGTKGGRVIIGPPDRQAGSVCLFVCCFVCIRRTAGRTCCDANAWQRLSCPCCVNPFQGPVTDFVCEVLVRYVPRYVVKIAPKRHLVDSRCHREIYLRHAMLSNEPQEAFFCRFGVLSWCHVLNIGDIIRPKVRAASVNIVTKRINSRHSLE